MRKRFALAVAFAVFGSLYLLAQLAWATDKYQWIELDVGLANALSSRIKQNDIPRLVGESLQKVAKNLVLDSTRGEKEVALYKKASPAVVFVLTNTGVIGSGAIIDAKGSVVTNWHVVKDEPSVVVIFKPKDSAELRKDLAFPAQVVKTDQVSDLALLKIASPPKAISSLILGDNSDLAVGQDVHAIGHPSGEIWTYTRGVISQIRANYEWGTSEGLKHRGTVIQTQTPINPGNSGGPLLDDQGRLIGINSFRRDGEALNYAVAINEIKDFLQRKQSRESSPVLASEQPRCLETYDTTGKGWPNVLGCYSSSTNPPPEFWAIRKSSNTPPNRIAIDSERNGSIDYVVAEDGNTRNILWHYIDYDCDGVVDVIGHQKADKDKIDSYKRSEKTIYIKNLVRELDLGFKTRKIPYRIQLCQ
jgi:S1-C subfamily serine protease